MRIVIALIFLSSACFGWEHDQWLNQAQKHIDQEAIDWFREQIREGLQNSNPIDNKENMSKHCLQEEFLTMEPNVFVFISFSVPDESWLNLSQELEKYAGVFVIRGLPNNSFTELYKKLAELKKRGMRTPIQIDPSLFHRFQIDKVPTFVFQDHVDYHKISGNTSLEYALTLLTQGHTEVFPEESIRAQG